MSRLLKSIIQIRADRCDRTQTQQEVLFTNFFSSRRASHLSTLGSIKKIGLSNRVRA
jgi:hypothetical protein